MSIEKIETLWAEVRAAQVEIESTRKDLKKILNTTKIQSYNLKMLILSNTITFLVTLILSYFLFSNNYQPQAQQPTAVVQQPQAQAQPVTPPQPATQGKTEDVINDKNAYIDNTKFFNQDFRIIENDLLINGDKYKEGDMIYQRKIVKISPDKIVIFDLHTSIPAEITPRRGLQ